MNDLAERLKQLRKEQDLSQSQLGEFVGANYNLIGRYERGASMPSADTLARLAEVLEYKDKMLVKEFLGAFLIKKKLEDLVDG